MDFEEMKEKVEKGMSNIGAQNCRITRGMTVCTKRFPNSNLEINLLKYDPSKDSGKNKREEFVAIWVGNQTSDIKPKKWQVDSVKKMGVVFSPKKASLITNHIKLSKESKEKGYETIGKAISRERRDLDDAITLDTSNRGFNFWEIDEKLITMQLGEFEPAFLDLYKFAIYGDKLPMQNREADATIYNQIDRKNTLLDILRGMTIPSVTAPSKEKLSLTEH